MQQQGRSLFRPGKLFTQRSCVAIEGRAEGWLATTRGIDTPHRAETWDSDVLYVYVRLDSVTDFAVKLKKKKIASDWHKIQTVVPPFGGIEGFCAVRQFFLELRRRTGVLFCCTVHRPRCTLWNILPFEKNSGCVLFKIEL